MDEKWIKDYSGCMNPRCDKYSNNAQQYCSRKCQLPFLRTFLKLKCMNPDCEKYDSTSTLYCSDGCEIHHKNISKECMNPSCVHFNRNAIKTCDHCAKCQQQFINAFEKEKSKMKLVYIAGPYSDGDVAINVKDAIDAGSKVIDAGYSVVVPHLTHFIHMMHPKPYDKWMAIDKEVLLRCDAVWRLEGQSKGADKEVDTAIDHGIHVVYTLNSLIEYLQKLTEREKDDDRFIELKYKVNAAEFERFKRYISSKK